MCNATGDGPAERIHGSQLAPHLRPGTLDDADGQRRDFLRKAAAPSVIRDETLETLRPGPSDEYVEQVVSATPQVELHQRDWFRPL